MSNPNTKTEPISILKHPNVSVQVTQKLKNQRIMEPFLL